MLPEARISVIGGAIILSQRMTAREYAGCALILAAVVIAQLPEKRLPEAQKEQKKRKQKDRSQRNGPFVMPVGGPVR